MDHVDTFPLEASSHLHSMHCRSKHNGLICK